MPLKDDDRIKEQIRFNTEIIKLILVGFLATSSAVLSLIMSKGSSAVENLFTVGGMILAVGCIVALIKKFKETQNLIK